VFILRCLKLTGATRGSRGTSTGEAFVFFDLVTVNRISGFLSLLADFFDLSF
jgi:hypothetical protein